MPTAATAILDDASNPVTGRGGKPLTQSNDLGRVIVYLRDHVGRNMLGLHAGAPEDFFDQILLACRCRNQIAHEGDISVPAAPSIAGYSAQFAFRVKIRRLRLSDTSPLSQRGRHFAT